MKLSLMGVLLLCLFSCTKNKVSDEKVLNLVVALKVSGYDPAVGGDLYTTGEMGRVYDGLYEFHPTKRPYELMPNLATDLPKVSKDGMTYTFELKKGVLFRDDPAFKDGKGRELKAADVVYSIKRLADPKIQSRGWWLFDDRVKGLNEWRDNMSKADKTNYDEEVSGLKVLNDHSFELTLKKPFPQLLYSFAMAYTFVVAREAVEHYGKEFLNHPVGTGPFILPKYDQGTMIVYTKNPKFREKFNPDDGARVPGVDKITVEILTEAQPRWLKFLKGKYDYMDLPKDYYEQLVDPNTMQVRKEFKDKGIGLIAEPMLDVTFYAFNNEHPLFKKNLKLRQALSLAVDRDGENKLFYNNTALKANGPIPPGMGGYNKEFQNPYIKFDLELSKKLLAEAGYPGGKGLPEIVVETTTDTVSRQGLEFFTKCMDKIGVKVRMGSNSWPELVNKVSKKQHMMYTMAWGADYPDAENFLGLLYCPNQAPGSNGSNYCNPAFDELFRKSTIMQDSPERTALYEKANQMVALDVPWIFMFHRTKFYVTQGWLKNFQFMEFNHSQFQYLTIDVAEKKKLMEKF